MKIALIGASGARGVKILAEAVSRGHDVTGIARHPEKLGARPHLTAKKGDVYEPDGLANILTGHDAVVSAVHFTASDPQLLIAAVKKSGVKRYLVVGGAGSLKIPSGTRLVDTPDFPALYKNEALAGAAFLDMLRAEKDLEWSYLSPSAVIAPGSRTGKFRLGKDDLLVGADGKSFISEEDYAIAMIDEIERPQHVRQRFTVGY
jgi:putative NADH-flavin reductase